MRAVAGAALLACLTSCGSGGGDSPTQAAKFSAIYAQIFPAKSAAKCNFCHSQPASNVSNGNLFTGAEGDTSSAVAALVDKTSTSKSCSGRALVVPGKPAESLFYLKLTADPPCGARMPFGNGALSDAQIEMVKTWIEAGAQDD